MCMCRHINDPIRAEYSREFEGMPVMRKLAKQRRPAPMTHDDAVKSGRRVESKVLSAHELLLETHKGISIYVENPGLPYFDIGLHVPHDPMHEISNTVRDVIDLVMCKGTQSFNTKRLNTEKSFGRFQHLQSRQRPFFALKTRNQKEVCMCIHMHMYESMYE